MAAPKFCVTPYLQRPSTDAMTIVFFTDAECEATVEAWPANAARPEVAPCRATTKGAWAQALTNNVCCKESSVWGNSLYRHRVRFNGLESNRTYGYTVTLDGGAAYTNAFRTAPDRDTPIRFVSYADCETEKNPWNNYVANLKRMKDRRPDFFALAGDYAARGGRQEHWDGFWQANAGRGTDVAGSIPIMAAVGNHDLFDQGSHTGGWYYDMQGEPSTERYLSYFESTSNGVDYANAPRPHAETRDLSQLFHREDYGPVTLIFLDTNNGQDGDTDSDHDKDTNYLDKDDGSHLKGGLDRRKGCRHPDFNIGSPQYVWLTNNLADAQANARFTFVFNHHCPYSRGAHNKDWRDHEDGSAKALRALTETMVRYGVDGWYCGHDELLEHSITNGWEILPNGQRRRHTLSIYDLGCSGDTPRSSNVCTNPLEYWWSSDNYGGSGSYGFLETDVTTNKFGKWTCTITPVRGSTGDYVSGAQIVYVEKPDRAETANDLVYAESANAKNPIDGASQTKPSDWLAWKKPPEGPSWDESVEVAITGATAADLTYNGSVQAPSLTVKAGDLVVPGDHYEVSAWTKEGETASSDLKDAGTYTATVTGLGNATGEAVVRVTVGRAPATVKAKDVSVIVGTDPEPLLEVEISGMFGNDAVTYTSLSRAHGTGIGRYEITVIGEEEQGNYIVTFENGWFTIREDVPFVDEGTKWQSNYTIQEGETSGVIWAEYDNKDRWWKFDGGDATIAAPVFVDANPNEPKMSGCHTNHVRFAFTGLKAGTTTWKAYTYTDGGQQAAHTYPGYASPNPSADGRTHGSGSWSKGSGISITITVTEIPLPPLTDGEKSRIAEILSSSPDALLKASVSEVKDYMAYRAWVDKGVEAGTIDSQTAAKGVEGSFFSFATDQDRIVDPAVISDDKVKVKEVKVNDGGIRLTVGIEDLPVGKNAQAEYLEKVFGVVGSEALTEFAADKVKYGEMQNNGDGTVSYTAEPNVEPKPDAFFFKATIAR